MQFGAFFSAVNACKKVIDIVSDVKHVPNQAKYLWRFVDALRAPLLLAAQLQARQQSSDFVGAAIHMCHEVLTECEDLLLSTEANGRPDGAGSWQEWWSAIPSRTREDLSRVQLLPQLVAKVQNCCCAVQLALLTVQMQGNALAAPLCLSQDAIGRARSILHLFEMGRLESPFYQLCHGAVSRGAEMISLDAAVLLVGGESGFRIVMIDASDISELRGTDQLLYKPFTIGSAADMKQRVLVPVAECPIDASCRPQMGVDKERRLFLSLTSAGGKGTSVLKVTFGACAVPAQFCVFPLGHETYYSVTIETCVSLIALIAGLAKNGKRHVDEVLPESEDDWVDHLRDKCDILDLK